MNTYQITAKPKEGVMGGTWVDGHINGLRFQAKIYGTGSRFGINEGRVSKLAVWDESNRHLGDLLSYDRGWDKQPADDYQRKLLQALLEYLEGIGQDA